MKYPLSIIMISFAVQCNSQKLISTPDKIETAKRELNTTISVFNNSIVNSDLENCIDTLLESVDNEYKKYLIGGLLYNIEKDKSFQLHKEAYLSKPDELNFNLEYAIELHRKGEYGEAAKLYEGYAKEKIEDFRVNVWLADCYINTENIDKSIENWDRSNHAKNHVSIDEAINIIYGKSDQLKIRNNYRNEIKRGNRTLLYSLIFLDMNWEMDWWNTTSQKYFLNEDVRLLESEIEKNSADYNTIKTYVKIKNLSKSDVSNDSIKILLTNSKMILGSNPLPTNGQITSDLLRICFMKQLISEEEFFSNRGEELLKLAQSIKDKELLNIYAYLQATVNGKVDQSIDKLGWTSFKDERFAISYFIGKADKNKFNDIELAQALSDFPGSSKLYWVKVNCAKIENINLKPYLIELIKREFKTLGSDQSHSSYPLKSYFGYLNTLK